MNRQQRRALDRSVRKGKRPAAMSQAVRSVEKAVKNLEKVQDFDGTLDEIRTLLTNSQQSLEAMTAEYQALAGELVVQRELTIRLLTILVGKNMAQRDLNDWTEGDLDRIRALEDSLRESYLAAQGDS